MERHSSGAEYNQQSCHHSLSFSKPRLYDARVDGISQCLTDCYLSHRRFQGKEDKDCRYLANGILSRFINPVRFDGQSPPPSQCVTTLTPDLRPPHAAAQTPMRPSAPRFAFCSRWRNFIQSSFVYLTLSRTLQQAEKRHLLNNKDSSLVKLFCKVFKGATSSFTQSHFQEYCWIESTTAPIS